MPPKSVSVRADAKQIAELKKFVKNSKGVYRSIVHAVHVAIDEFMRSRTGGEQK